MKTNLLENFYTELSSTYSTLQQDEFSCEIRLNAEHPIYEGHFKDFPIAPGVCLVQVIKEVLIGKFQKDLILVHGNNIKFLAIVNPNETPLLSVVFSVRSNEHSMDVTASYNHNDTVYMKFKGSFQIMEN